MGYRHFGESMRMELAILRGKGYAMRDIASALNISHSSVVRELKRNAVKGQYDPGKADHKACYRRKYSKYQGMKLRNVEGLEDYVKEKLQAGWTPEEIAGRLKMENGKTIISFKGIYKWLYSAYGLSYVRCLPYRKMYRRKRKGKKTKHSLIPNRVWIDARPVIIEERRRVGDFEGDTLGKPKGCPETLVGMADRKSRYFLARKVQVLRRSMEDGFHVLLRGLEACSLTLDSGPENVRHESLWIPTYFCHPYHSWEKGTIENTFQRLRRHIPKRADLKAFPDEVIAFIVERMNNTPRKCLGYRTPAEVFKEH